MPTINQLPPVDTISSSDQVPIYVSSDGDARRASMSLIKSFVNQDNQSLTIQYGTPTVSVTTFTINASSNNIWLILTAATPISLEVVMPPVSSAFEGQEITITSPQEIPNLTMSGNGASLVGEPDGLNNNGSFTMRFESVTSTWYCVAVVNQVLY